MAIDRRELGTTLLECTDDMILVMDECVIAMANTTATSTLGFDSPDQIDGLALWDISADTQLDGSDSRAKAEQCVAMALEAGSCTCDWLFSHRHAAPVRRELVFIPYTSDSRTRVVAIAKRVGVLESQRSSRLLREVTSAVPGVVFQFFAKPDGSIGHHFISEQAESMFGLKPDPDTFIDEFVRHVVPDYRKDLLTSVRDSISNVTEWKFEGQFLRPSGEVMWFGGHSVPQRHDDEIVFNGVLLDITESKQAEEALRQSEEKYRELVQNANSIILRWDSHGAVRFLNEFGQAFFGYAEDEIVGKNVLGTIVPQTETSGRDLAELMRTICVDPGCHESNVNENVRKNGERVWIAWTNKPIFDETGQLVEILSVGSDITERRRSQEALKQSEERLRTVIGNVPVVLFAIDSQGIFTLSEGCGLAGLGLEAGEVAGRSVFEVYGQLPEVVDFIKRGLAGEPQHAELQFGESWYEVWINPLCGEFGRPMGVIGVGADITERHKAAQALQVYADIVQTMQVGLYVYQLEDPTDDRTLVLTSANPASTAELGLREDEIIGRRIDDIFPGLRERGIPQRFAEVALTGKPFVVDEFQYGDPRVALSFFSFRVFPLSGNRVGVLFEDITEVKRAEEEKKQFYRETISSVTDGRLLIVSDEETKTCEADADLHTRISTYADTVEVRRLLEQYCRDRDLTGDGLALFLTGLGEAMTNAIKHAKGGEVFAGCRQDELWVGVRDNGVGIAALALPRATLLRGYSTKVSMGLGYSIMLDVADRIMLNTGPAGTTVILFKRLAPVEPTYSLDSIPDTWDSIA